ncbi:MAG: metallophosphoesterase [Paludibacteraceae bacterium]|nr:metallophosphoesterase [Paludibacteraceae bacterium]
MRYAPSHIARWVILTVLIAGGAVLCATRWRAWFGNPPEPEWTGDTIPPRFCCFGDAEVPEFVCRYGVWCDTVSPDTLTLLLLGDVHNSITRPQWDSLSARHPGVEVYAQLGDFLERGYPYYVYRLAESLRGTRFDSLPLLAVPGNHEYYKGLRRTLPPLWTDLFHNPHNGPQDFPGTTYYVDFRHLRFIVIDTNGLQRVRDYTRVNYWLRQTMQQAGDRFVVVMMHHPVYSAGAGRQNVPVYLTFRRPLAEADLVFAGHDHNYARRLPFVDTNSAVKTYIHKLSPAFERVGAGCRFYQLLTLTADTMYMETRLFDSGELYDRVAVSRDAEGRRTYDVSSDLGEERIELPERYRDRTDKPSARIRRFLNRRAARQRAAI